MAIRTVYHGCGSHRRFQTGDILVYAGRHNGMKRKNGWVKFKPRIRLGYLPGDCRLRPVRIISVAFETDFLFVLNPLGAAPGGCYAGDSAHRTGNDGGSGNRILNSMRIMTINALDVHD